MLTLPPDPYLALGVSREAQLSEIRTAYRKLVLKCHPDKIQDPLLKQQKQDEFQKVQQAYELLSSETEKSKYDDMYKLNELQKEMNRMSTSSSGQPRSSRREREPEYYNGARVYTAEPRASTFASPSKGYAAGTPPSRSYEEFSVPNYDHHPPRKTASWEKRASRDEREDKYERKSKKDDKRDREEKARKEEKEKREKKDAERREKERRKEKEERKEREEKERKEKKKKVEQQRKKEAEFKTQTPKPAPPRAHPSYTAAYSSDSDSDELYSSARKASGTRENIKPVATSERERKYSENMDIATSYLERSGARVNLNNRPLKPQATEQFTRLNPTIPMAAPTPPPPPSGPHAPPPPPPPPQYDEEETLHRSSTTKSASRRAEKPSSAKKSTRASSRDPTSVEYTRGPPPLSKSHTMPPEYTARVHPGRAHTEYTVRPSIGTMPRAQTFMESRSEYLRDRSPTRHRRGHYSEDEEDSDDARRHRRSKHRSPERTFRYTVEPGKTSTRQVSHEEIPRQKSSKPTYHQANTGVRMEPGVYDTYPAPHPGMKVNYAPTYGEDEIKFARVPHGTTFRSEFVGTY